MGGGEGGWKGVLIQVTSVPLSKRGGGGGHGRELVVVLSPPYPDNSSWPPSQGLISLENKSRHVGMYALTRFAKQKTARE